MDTNRARYGTGGSRGAGDEDKGQYIRLRYSTQFTTGGRTHMIEMEVPVPVGASAELREQLIREAEANMEQLYRRVEARARGQRPSEAAQRPVPPSQHQQPAQAAMPPAQQSRPSADQRAQPSQASPAASASSTAASGVVHEGPSAISLTDRRAGASSAASAGSVGQTGQTEQTQAYSGSSPDLLVVPGIASLGSGPMKLSEFIQIIRESWGLAPKEAMELLQVKSLNNMNYRDLLRQLEPLVAQASASPANPVNRPALVSSNAFAQPGSSGPARPPMPASSPQQSPQSSQVPPATSRREQGASSRPAALQANAPTTSRPPVPAPARLSSERSVPSAPAAAARMEGPANIPIYPLREHVVREPVPAYKFDEEDDEEEEDDEMEPGTEEAAEEGSMSEAMARIKIDELRDMRGTVAANPGRLVVLHNLLDSQISDEQFLQLIGRLWNAVSDKKLKQDQVEGLISWAKEDYFEDEVRAVLAVLNEQV